jgi:hypothetical protein
MEVTKWLKPSISVSRIGDSASVEQMASTQCACVVGLCQKKSHTMNKKIFRADALFITSQRDSLFVYADRRLQNPDTVARIANHFALPAQSIVVRSDARYRT